MSTKCCYHEILLKPSPSVHGGYRCNCIYYFNRHYFLICVDSHSMFRFDFFHALTVSWPFLAARPECFAHLPFLLVSSHSLCMRTKMIHSSTHRLRITSRTYQWHSFCYRTKLHGSHRPVYNDEIGGSACTRISLAVSTRLISCTWVLHSVKEMVQNVNVVLLLVSAFSLLV